jgi:hypothetical protein
MLDLVTPTLASPPAPTRTVAAAPPAEAHMSFHTLLSELNPLQYLPIIGTIYRAVTGDTIPEAVRSVGSFIVSGLIGGPIGLATNAALLAIEKMTGIDPEKIGHDLLVSIGVGHADANTVVSAAAAQSAPPEAPPDFVGWSPAQLMAYGVTSAAGGVMRRGAVEGADVLNGLELARHGSSMTAPLIA